MGVDDAQNEIKTLKRKHAGNTKVSESMSFANKLLHSKNMVVICLMWSSMKQAAFKATFHKTSSLDDPLGLMSKPTLDN